VIDLQLAPFGNAKIISDNDDKTVTCQHGDAECDANSWEQCAIFVYPLPDKHLPFFGCLEGTLPMGHEDVPFDAEVFGKCADESGLEFDRLRDCHDNPETSWALQEKYANMTPDDHDHVPWVLIDGWKFDEEKEDLAEEVCKAYTRKTGGLPHPNCASVIDGVPKLSA